MRIAIKQMFRFAFFHLLDVPKGNLHRVYAQLWSYVALTERLMGYTDHKHFPLLSYSMFNVTRQKANFRPFPLVLSYFRPFPPVLS